MRRIFLRTALERLLERLGDDHALLCDSAGWATDRRALASESLLPHVSAVARRAAVYAGCPDAPVVDLALEAGLHLVAIGPPVRAQATLIVHRSQMNLATPRSPIVAYGSFEDHAFTRDGSVQGVPVVFGGPAAETLLPLYLQAGPRVFADAVRITAAFATETLFLDVRTALPWTLIARHRQATVVAPASSPEHVLLAYGTDGQNHGLLLQSLTFTKEAPCW